MKRIVLLVFTISIIYLTPSCTDATKSQIGGLNSEHLIEMYSGGKKVKEWVSTGKVKSSSSSDGYYFRDKECKCNVEVSGDIVITRIKE